MQKNKMEFLQKNKIEKQRKNTLFLTRKISIIFSFKIFFKAFLKLSLIKKHTNDKLSLHQNFRKKYFNQDLIIFIETEKISHFITSWVYSNSTYVHSSDYFLTNFDLLKHCKEINQIPTIKIIEDLQSENFIHKNTKYYKKLNDSIKNNKPIIKQQILLNTEEKVTNYFTKIHTLHQSIMENGLISNVEFSKYGKQHIDREIGIAINNDGTIIKLQGGQHRFSIAKLQKIEKIPVEIRLIHKDVIENISNKYKISSVEAIYLIKDTLANKSSIDSLLI